MLYRSIRLKHGKVLQCHGGMRVVLIFNADIYGTRLGKGQLAKDPRVFQRDEAANIVSATLPLNTRQVHSH